MHSSTSSSSVPAYDEFHADQGRPETLDEGAARGIMPRHIVLLVVSLVASVVALEAGTRVAFSRVSHIEQRTATEHAEAIRIRPVAGTKSVLLIGNSLLLEGVDHALLQRSLPSSMRAYRFTIESTRLFDWKFGLRRLLEDGSHPDVVAVSVGEQNMLPTVIRGDYSAYYLFRTSDIPEIADSVGYDNTRLSNLYFARYSLFYAGRSGLRNFVLNKLDPSYGNLLHSLAPGASAAPPEAPLEAATAERLRDMRASAEAHGARLVLIVPPGFATSYEAAVVRGAARARVPVIAPVPQGAWGQEMFRDGFHLNERGAREFTRLLTPLLAAAVTNEVRAASALNREVSADAQHQENHPK